MSLNNTVLSNVASDRSPEIIYSVRNLDQPSQMVLSEWLCQQNIPNPIPFNKLHCSVICACSGLPAEYIPDRRRVSLEPWTYGLGVIGPAFALFFKCDPLQRQWDDAVENGVHMRYPKFVPHISLSYSVQPEWNYATLTPPIFSLTLDAEVVCAFDPQHAKSNWQNA